MSNVQDIPLHLIFVDEIARPVNQERVVAYAAMFKEHGMNQAILVEAVGKKYRLVFGRHRFEAAKLNEEAAIKASIKTYNHTTAAQERTIDRVMENLGRGELNALERAEHLASLKDAYETVNPDKKRGVAGGKARQGSATAIFALADEVAEKCGLSERSFFLSVAICKGLSAKLRETIHGTWLAGHQAGLKLLSEQKPAQQAEILDILFADEPKATSVADALIIVTGQRLLPANEKRIKSTQGNLEAMNRNERISVLSCFEDEIREIAKMKGWV